MEINRFTLYCSTCKDFVYDRDFENIYNGESLRNAEIVSMVQGKNPGWLSARYCRAYVAIY